MSERRTLIESLLSLFRGTEKESNPNVKVTYTTLEDVDETAPDEDKLEPSSPVEKVYVNLDTVEDLRPGRVHLHGLFRTIDSHFVRNGLRVTDGLFSDNTGSVRVVWFAANVAPLIKNGVVYELRGNFALKNGRFQIMNPKFRDLEEGCGTFEKAKKVEEPETAPTQANVWTAPIGGRGLASDSEWKALRTKVFQKDNYTCRVCGARTNLTVDHKLPLGLGGTNAISNLQTLCKDCHEDKHYRNFLDRKFDAIDDYGKNYEPTVKIKKLSKALKSRTGVRISYTDRDGVHTNRTIHPKDLYKGYRYMGKIVNKNKVYVNAFCELDNADRTFRVSRMKLL